MILAQTVPSLDEIVTQLITSSQPLQWLLGIVLFLLLIVRLRQLVKWFFDLLFGDLDDERAKVMESQVKVIEQNEKLVTNYQKMLQQYEAMLEMMDKTEPSRRTLEEEHERNRSKDSGAGTEKSGGAAQALLGENRPGAD